MPARLEKVRTLCRPPSVPSSLPFSTYLKVVLQPVGLEETDDRLGVVVVLVGRRLLGLGLWGEREGEKGEQREKTGSSGEG